MRGVDLALIDRDGIARRIPTLDMSREARYPVWVGYTQERAGRARHDAVALGLARGADKLGVHIIQGCEVSGFRRSETGRVTGVEINRGYIAGDALVDFSQGVRFGLKYTGGTTAVRE